MDEWRLGQQLAGAMQELGQEEGAAWWSAGTVKVLVKHQAWCPPPEEDEDRAYQVLMPWLRDEEVQRFLQVNRHMGVLWFNRESFEQLLAWMMAIAAVRITAGAEAEGEEDVARAVVACYDVVERLRAAEAASDYQVVKLMEAAKGPTAGVSSDERQTGAAPIPPEDRGA